MLYSFDIFDTLLTRRTATPDGIFAVMQYELLSNDKYKTMDSYIKSNFYNIRIHAEELARLQYVKNGVEEINLKQIYNAIEMIGFLNPNEIEALMELEIRTEQENIVGIEKNINKIKELLGDGNRVILISDMYLDKVIISNLLITVDHIFKTLPIYVSSDYGLCKHTSSLYVYIKQKETINYKEWVHFGNDILADVDIPSRLGINAIHYTYEELLEIEKILLNKKSNDFKIQLSIGASRNARLLHSGESIQHKVGSSIAAPILYEYISWLLNQCNKLRLNKLYFIARDGYILKKIADTVIDICKLPMQTHYLYGSRKAWRMPAYDGSKEMLTWILSYSNPERIKSIGDLADVLLLDLNELYPFIPEKYIKRNLSIYDVDFIAKTLIGNECFRFYLKKRFDNKEKLLGYLKQEIGGADRCAFIDLSGTGLTSVCLSKLLDDIGNVEKHFFYFNIDTINTYKKAYFHVFAPSNVKFKLVLELFCRALHGQTIDFCLKENVWHPVLEESPSIEKLYKYGYVLYINGVMDYTKNIIESDMMLKKVLAPDFYYEYMEQIFKEETLETLDFLGDMPYNVTGRDSANTFAPHLTKKQIRDIWLFHYCEGWENFYSGANIDFAIARCSSFEKKMITRYMEKLELIKSKFYNIWNKKLYKKTPHDIFFERFPWNVYGKKYLVYGAGEMGKYVVKYIKKCDGCNVVGWLDKKYVEMRNAGIHLDGDIKCIKNYDFDILLIAIMDDAIAKDVKNDVIVTGIAHYKVKSLNDMLRERYLA